MQPKRARHRSILRRGSISIPAAQETNLVSAGAADIFVLKLDSAGTYQWVKGLAAPAPIAARQ
jgi:hypothetical protein